MFYKGFQNFMILLLCFWVSWNILNIKKIEKMQKWMFGTKTSKMYTFYDESEN